MTLGAQLRENAAKVAQQHNDEVRSSITATFDMLKRRAEETARSGLDYVSVVRPIRPHDGALGTPHEMSRHLRIFNATHPHHDLWLAFKRWLDENDLDLVVCLGDHVNLQVCPRVPPKPSWWKRLLSRLRSPDRAD